MKQELENPYQSLSGTQAVEEIRTVAKAAGICLFGTLLDRAPLTVRPMAVQSVDDAGNIWFLSSRASHTNRHIEEDARVQLLFANPGKSEYMTLQGRASISDDRQDLVQRRRRRSRSHRHQSRGRRRILLGYEARPDGFLHQNGRRRRRRKNARRQCGGENAVVSERRSLRSRRFIPWDWIRRRKAGAL